MWWRAWAAIPRQWVDALAVAAATVVAVMVAASAPLFVASVGNDVLMRHLSTRSPAEAGVTVTVRRALAEPAAFDDLEAQVAAQVAATPLRARPASLLGTGAGVQTRLFRADAATTERVETVDDTQAWMQGSRSAQLASDPSALAAMDVVWQASRDGVWILEEDAEELGLEPGDAVVYTASNQVVTPDGLRRLAAQAPVAGVYRNPWDDALLASSWEQVPPEYLPSPPSADTARTLLLADTRTVQTLALAVGEPLLLQLRYELTDTTLTVPQALAVERRVGQLERDFADGRTAVREAVRELAGPASVPAVESGLRGGIEAARTGQDAVLGPLRSLAVAGVALALGVVGAAGAFVTDRQRQQCRALWLRGVSPVAFAVRRTWEFLPVVAVGVLFGWGAGLAAVRIRGPWAALEAPWVVTSLWWALAAAAAALVAMAIATAATAYRLVGSARGSRATRWIALAALLTASAAALASVREGQERSADVVVQALPLLLATSAAMVAAIVVEAAVRVGSERTRTPWVDLGLSRARVGLRTGGPLLAAVAVAAGAITYAAILANSVEAGANDKAMVVAGAGSVAVLRDSHADVPTLPPQMVVVLQATVQIAPGGDPATLLALDTDHAHEVGLWRDFAAVDTGGVLAELRAADTGRLLPVVAAGHALADRGTAVTIRGSQFAVDAQVVTAPAAWPGMGGGRPLYLTDVAALANAVAVQVGTPEIEDMEVLEAHGVLDALFVEVWSTMESSELTRSLEPSGVTIRRTRSAMDALTRAELTAQIATVDFLRLLGTVASTVALAAIALYVSTRHRERILSYALSRRMGLSATQHRLALAVELATLVLVAVVVAVPVTIAASHLVIPTLDPLPLVPPTTAVLVPATVVATILSGAIAVVVATSLLAHTAAARADVTETLRVTD